MILCLNLKNILNLFNNIIIFLIIKKLFLMKNFLNYKFSKIVNG